MQDLCRKDVVTIAPDASIVEAARTMRDRHVGCLVIVDAERHGRPIGILTDRDIVVGMLANGAEALDLLLVRDLVMRPLVTARHDEPLRDVVGRMRRQGVRRIPVLDDDGVLCGLVAADDVIRLLAQEMQDLAMLVEGERERETVARP